MGIRKYYNTKFRSVVWGTQNDGTVRSGVENEVQQTIIDGIPWVHSVVGTQTVLVGAGPLGNNDQADGWDFNQDATAGDGCVLCPFVNHSRSPLAFTIGTDPAFFVRLKMRVAQATNCILHVGFHGGASDTTMQALQDAREDYTDKATIGVNADNITTETALNNAADTTTDTTDDATDDTQHDFKVLVSSAGVVTYQHDIAAIGTLAEPTSVVSYTFDDTDVVVPFIHFENVTGDAGIVELLEFECGYQ